MRRKIASIVLVCLLLVPMIAVLQPVAAANPQSTVYEVELNDTVEKGLFAYLKRAFKEAEDAQAEIIVIRMNTPGGAIDAADEIGQLFTKTNQKIIVYVEDNAISAGSFIALMADEIYMTPTARMGASQAIVSDGTAADEKVQSYWNSLMITAAESQNRNPKFAQAMADPSVDLPEYRAGKGKLLTLTAAEAEKVGYSEGTVATYDDLLAQLKLSDAQQVKVEMTFSEKVARIITHPIVIPILLSIAGLGLVVELYSPGFGVAGTMALTSLGLFFFGHLVAGLAGYETLLIFILGVGLLIAELFVSGGILGIIGAVLVGTSIIMAGADPMHMTISVLIAVTIATIGVVVTMKFFGKRLHLLNKMVLMDSTSTDQGYVSNENRTELLGQIGVTLTPLRPAGVMRLNDERIDIVSDGGFINANESVKVIEVEGSKIVVTKV